MRLPQDRILHIGTELAGDEVRVVAEWQGELVRCKYCRYMEIEDEPIKGAWCTRFALHDMAVGDMCYCSWGERREL